MKRSEVAKLVGMLVAAYPHRETVGQTTRVYEENLIDLDAEPAGRAVQRLIRSSTFLPTIAEIRAAATEVSHGPRKTGAEAWQVVQRAIDKIGGYGKPRFQDPIIQGIIERWGWPRMCWEGHPESDRARFIEMYDAEARRDRLDEVSGVPLPPARSTGFHELGEEAPPALPTAQAKRVIHVVTPKSLPPLREVEPRRMTAEELEAAMNKTGSDK